LKTGADRRAANAEVEGGAKLGAATHGDERILVNGLHDQGIPLVMVLATVFT
jgi:hypothetical protein